MGKFFCNVVGKTPLETRQKKDGTGSYEYADVSLQLYDMNGQPSVHQTFDWRTGEAKTPAGDTIKYDAIREAAIQLNNLNLQIGEIVIADLMVEVNRFGRNEITVRSVARQQPQGPQSNIPQR
jgi:hypothetical protein